jgi:mono/diheme cytochrome c family protein
VGKTGQRAPDLQPTAKLAGTRVEGETAAQYLVESMINPGAYVVEGYTDQMPPMNRPPKSLTPAEIYMVICYLQDMGGTEITVTKADIPDADKAPDELAASAEPVAVVLPGDPEKGKAFFFSYGACFACHMVDGEGQEVGPDLSAIAAVSALDYITESILEPNKVVVGGYPAIMPTGYGSTIKAKDFNDLVSYLMTLQGGQ